MTDEEILNRADLRQFTGSENFYRHALVRSILYTDGVQYVAETGGAYWLIDAIALAQKYDGRSQARSFSYGS